LHERLRSVTRELHVDAERALDIKRRFASRSAYAGLLATLYGLHEAYERALAAFDLTEAGIDLTARKRAQWLAADLSAMGEKLPDQYVLAYPPQSSEAALGTLYVLEGSTQGGRILLNAALQVPGVTSTRGARFFAGHGARTTPYWLEFLRVLNAVPSDGPAAARVESAATSTFREYIAALKGITWPAAAR
jgi:heme oxygenase